MGVTMKRKTQVQKKLARLLVSFCYGSLLGLIIGLITGNLVLAVALAIAVSGAVSGAVSSYLAFVLAISGALPTSRDVEAFAGAAAAAGTLAMAVAVALEKIADNKEISPKELIDEHIDWLVSVSQKLRLFIKNRDHAETIALSHVRKRDWDVQLVVSFVNELAAIYPEEWNEWQHWISDMMDSRTRMQSKGMNHRIVSLITFYRLTRFAWHIGIDKVFILATRRTTR